MDYNIESQQSRLVSALRYISHTDYVKLISNLNKRFKEWELIDLACHHNEAFVSVKGQPELVKVNYGTIDKVKLYSFYLKD